MEVKQGNCNQLVQDLEVLIRNNDEAIKWNDKTIAEINKTIEKNRQLFKTELGSSGLSRLRLHHGSTFKFAYPAPTPLRSFFTWRRLRLRLWP